MAAADRRKQKAVIATQAATSNDPQPSVPGAAPSTSQAAAFSVEPSTTDMESSSGGTAAVSASVGAESIRSGDTMREEEAMEIDTVAEETGGVGGATAVIS